LKNVEQRCNISHLCFTSRFAHRVFVVGEDIEIVE
jgi:hypothetical protein